VPVPPSSPIVHDVCVSIPSLEVVLDNIVLPVTKENIVSYPSLDVPLQIVLENSDFSIHDDPSIIDEDMIDDVIVVVYDDITCVKVDVIDATQDRVCKSVDVDIYKNEKIPQVVVDTDESFLEKVKHTQVGVVHKIVEVDIENDKHTQDGVVHVVESLSQVRVDDNFNNDGEQVIHNGYERCTQNAAIIKINENFNEEVQVNFDEVNEINKEKETKKVQVNFTIKENGINNEANFREKFNEDVNNEKRINKEKFLFKIACRKIINSLKKMVDNQKNFNLDMEKSDISIFDYGGDINKYDVMLLDDGRLWPRTRCDVDVSCHDISADLVDDGRCIPPRWCDVCFGVMDGRDWVFHDGG